MYSREDWLETEDIERRKGNRDISNILERKAFISLTNTPIVSNRFVCKLNDGWYLIKRAPSAYHGRPIDGWRVWWWKFATHVTGAWQGFWLSRP